jgi:hypothetical protein
MRCRLKSNQERKRALRAAVSLSFRCPNPDISQKDALRWTAILGLRRKISFQKK